MSPHLAPDFYQGIDIEAPEPDLGGAGIVKRGSVPKSVCRRCANGVSRRMPWGPSKKAGVPVMIR